MRITTNLVFLGISAQLKKSPQLAGTTQAKVVGNANLPYGMGLEMEAVEAIEAEGGIYSTSGSVALF